MKVIEPSVEIMRTGLETDIIVPEQFIERVGRTCYKSEDKITNDSAVKFVGNLVKRGHEAVIEHWNLIFKTDYDHYERFLDEWNILIHNCREHSDERLRPYIRFSESFDENRNSRYVVSGNMRAWRDLVKAYIATFKFLPRYLHGIVRTYPLFFQEYQVYTPEVYFNDILQPIEVKDLNNFERRTHQDVTVKFICDRGVSHEIVRHRVASFAQESTRYCNYSQDKFDHEITIVRPSWCDKGNDRYKRWFEGCLNAENGYFSLLDEGCTPQEARSVLPNSLKTEVVVTMNLDGWRHFFNLRCSPAAHPDMKEVADMAKEQFAAFIEDPTFFL